MAKRKDFGIFKMLVFPALVNSNIRASKKLPATASHTFEVSQCPSISRHFSSQHSLITKNAKAASLFAAEMNEAELLPCNLDSKHGEEPKLHQIQSSQKENHHTLPPIIIHLSVTWTPYSITIPTRRSFLFPGSGTPLFTIR